MITGSSIKKGKAIEYFLIHELLKNDLDVYTPVTDVEGVDIIIKNKKGYYVEVQVKSRMINKDEDFFSIKNFEPKENFFIVCHNINTNDFLL